MQSVVVDKSAKEAVDKLIDERLSDGMDIVQTASLSLMDETLSADRSVDGWMTKPVAKQRT